MSHDRFGVRPVSPEWWRGPMLGIDCETTGTDIETCHLVEIAAVIAVGGYSTFPMAGSYHALIKPGDYPIPRDATKVHKLTKSKLNKYGVPLREALHEIVVLLNTAQDLNWPIVLFNAPFDLGLIGRHISVSDLENIVDPQVITWEKQPWRRWKKGQGGLYVTAKEFGCWAPAGGSHYAWDDALTTIALAYAQARRWSDIGDLSLDNLHALQYSWSVKQKRPAWPSIHHSRGEDQ